MYNNRVRVIGFKNTPQEAMESLYIKDLDFSSVLDKTKMKSEEAYFGLDNPLRNRLVAHITLMREQWKKEIATNKRIRNIELLKNQEASIKTLETIIVEEFNLEGCNIGFENEVNAACFTQIWNKPVVGKSDDAKKMRVALDDIVESKQGFKYKNSTGIWYCLIIGIGLITDDGFTPAEVAAILVHELGHGMQHVVSSLNTTAMIEFWRLILEYTSISQISHIGPAKAAKMLKLCRLANKDPEKAAALGEEFLNEMRESETTDFKNFKGSDITAMVNENGAPLEGDVQKLPKEEKKNFLVRSIYGFFKSLVGIVFGIFLIPVMIGMNNTIKKNAEYKRFRVFEETADSFCSFYGLAPEQASALAKLNRVNTNAGVGEAGVFNYIPILDLMVSYENLLMEWMQVMGGYPPTKQRLVNQYIAVQYEIKNNPKLSAQAKAELMAQSDELKRVYDEYIDKQSPKGIFYNLIAKAGRESLDVAASRDKNVEENVLRPLKEKADKGFLA